MEEKWFIVGASVKGRYHYRDFLPCQDAHAYKLIDDDAGVIVVSDGAGSAENSEHGSALTVSLGIEYFESLLRDKIMLSETYVDWEKDSVETLKKIRDRISKYGKDQGITFKSMSATCIVLVFKGSHIYCVHIGDGRAAYRNKKGEWKSILSPFSGIYAGETVFITSDIFDEPEKYIETTVVDNDFDALTAITDGAESVCWEHSVIDPESNALKIIDPNKPYPPFFDSIIENIKELFFKGIPLEEVNTLWRKYLASGEAQIENEPDDKTIVLAVKI